MTFVFGLDTVIYNLLFMISFGRIPGWIIIILHFNIYNLHQRPTHTHAGRESQFVIYIPLHCSFAHQPVSIVDEWVDSNFHTIYSFKSTINDENYFTWRNIFSPGAVCCASWIVDTRNLPRSVNGCSIFFSDLQNETNIMLLSVGILDAA